MAVDHGDDVARAKQYLQQDFSTELTPVLQSEPALRCRAAIEDWIVPDKDRRRRRIVPQCLLEPPDLLVPNRFGLDGDIHHDEAKRRLPQAVVEPSGKLRAKQIERVGSRRRSIAIVVA